MIIGTKVEVISEACLGEGWEIGDIAVVVDLPVFPGDWYIGARVTGNGVGEIAFYREEVRPLDHRL